MFEPGTQFVLSAKGEDAARRVRTHVVNGGRLIDYGNALEKYAYYLDEAIRKRFVFPPFLIGTAARNLQQFIRLGAPTVVLNDLAREGYLEVVSKPRRAPSIQHLLDSPAPTPPTMPEHGTHREAESGTERPPDTEALPFQHWFAERSESEDTAPRTEANAQPEAVPFQHWYEQRSRARETGTLRERESEETLRRAASIARRRWRKRIAVRAGKTLVAILALYLVLHAGYYLVLGLDFSQTFRAIRYDWEYYLETARGALGVGKDGSPADADTPGIVIATSTLDATPTSVPTPSPTPTPTFTDEEINQAIGDYVNGRISRDEAIHVLGEERVKQLEQAFPHLR